MFECIQLGESINIYYNLYRKADRKVISQKSNKTTPIPLKILPVCDDMHWSQRCFHVYRYILLNSFSCIQSIFFHYLFHIRKPLSIHFYISGTKINITRNQVRWIGRGSEKFSNSFFNSRRMVWRLRFWASISKRDTNFTTMRLIS